MEKNEISEANNNLNFLLIHENLLDKEIIKMARGLQIECLFVENRLDEVNEKIARLLEIDDDNHHAHFYKSQLLFFSKNYDDALKSINKCLEKSEKIMPHPDFYMLKAMILKEQDNEEYIYYEEKSKELLKARDFIMEAMDDLKVDEDMFKN
ncbi:hypothetical protein COU57_06950 [Candidatus Pacearchaeota archaeon CG10_big_fil_rev_8_21_14_0_10_32_14]|nr:MAG: hypothetical protein COU57_06950 [Candidatus Pacearchaeota archaeon CG10_big_fil_rev_8_21_14_0_10_32_14]